MPISLAISSYVSLVQIGFEKVHIFHVFSTHGQRWYLVVDEISSSTFSSILEKAMAMGYQALPGYAIDYTVYIQFFSIKKKNDMQIFLDLFWNGKVYFTVNRFFIPNECNSDVLHVLSL